MSDNEGHRIDVTTTEAMAAALRKAAGRSRGAISAEVTDRLQRRECGGYKRRGKGKARLTFFVNESEYRALRRLGRHELTEKAQAAAGIMFLLTGDIRIPVNVDEMEESTLMVKYRPWAKYRRRQ